PSSGTRTRKIPLTRKIPTRMSQTACRQSRPWKRLSMYRASCSRAHPNRRRRHRRPWLLLHIDDVDKRTIRHISIMTTTSNSLALQIKDLLSTLSEHGRQHLNELETDLMQTNVLLTEAIEKLGASFMAIHEAVIAQQQLVDTL